jgi:hypothetical protein
VNPLRVGHARAAKFLNDQSHNNIRQPPDFGADYSEAKARGKSSGVDPWQSDGLGRKTMQWDDRAAKIPFA